MQLGMCSTYPAGLSLWQYETVYVAVQTDPAGLSLWQYETVYVAVCGIMSVCGSANST